jgi:hypothetical protein
MGRGGEETKPIQSQFAGEAELAQAIPIPKKVYEKFNHPGFNR